MNNDRHIWEGWHVSDFIEHLEIVWPNAKYWSSKQDVRNWCKDEQPYYKKHVVEVANYFIEKAKKSGKLLA